MTGAVLLTGTVGAGKTTTAEALSDLLWRRQAPHAVVDLDQVRLLRPPPPGDPFQHAVELANLRDLARNYRAAGAQRLILAGVVERRDDVGSYRDALGGLSLQVVRLTVEPEAGAARLRVRHAGDDVHLRWHLDRATELAAALDAADVEDHRVDTTAHTHDEVAQRIVRLVGW